MTMTKTCVWCLVAVFLALMVKCSNTTPTTSTSPSVPNQGYGDSCRQPSRLENGLLTKTIEPLVIHYTCHEGFSLIGPPKQRCLDDGTWDPPVMPSCHLTNTTTTRRTAVCQLPYVNNGQAQSYYDSPNVHVDFQAGDTLLIKCAGEFGIEINNKVESLVTVKCSQDGKWVTSFGWPILLDCNVHLCDSPPEIPNARMMLLGKESSIRDGVKVYYICDSGYSLVHPESEELVCSNGDWVGDLPSCVQLLNCSAPGKIHNGYSTVYGSENDWAYYNSPNSFNYPIGSRVQYFCNSGFKLEGPSIIACLQNRLWSHQVPRCVSQAESSKYCPKVSMIKNGHCSCDAKDDLVYCEPFYESLRVECVCKSGYKLIGHSIVTCQQNGTWDYKMPACVAEVSIDSSSDSQDDATSHMNTLAIVVATACSVLGVLLLIMVIMVFRRRKPRPHFSHHTTSTPQPYSRVQNHSIDEHDRVLLIGYGNSRIALPTYEEATSGRSHVSHFVSRPGSGQVGEYRPLPSIPGNFRGGSQSGNGDTSNRHSIITTSTMNRDGISEVFGSLDTVNVSVSDASTAVTVETFDSTVSRNSNMSGRATAGSLSSSSGSLVTEDAPLLDSNQRDEAIDLGENEDSVQDKTEN